MLSKYVNGGTLTQFLSKSETPTQDAQIMRFWTSLLELSKPLMRIHGLPLMDGGRSCLQGFVVSVIIS